MVQGQAIGKGKGKAKAKVSELPEKCSLVHTGVVCLSGSNLHKEGLSFRNSHLAPNPGAPTCPSLELQEPRLLGATHKFLPNLAPSPNSSPQISLLSHAWHGHDGRVCSARTQRAQMVRPGSLLDIQGNEAASAHQRHKGSSTLRPWKRQGPWVTLTASPRPHGRSCSRDCSLRRQFGYCHAYGGLAATSKSLQTIEQSGAPGAWGPSAVQRQSFTSDATKHQRTLYVSL